MSKENSFNMLDKYFKPKRITQIIGESSSLKESFLSIYLAHKISKTKTKLIYISSKSTINLRYIYETHKKIEGGNFSPNKIDKLYFFFQFLKFDSMGNFVLNKLPSLLEKEKNVSTIVINNFNNFTSTVSFKYQYDISVYWRELSYFARKYNLNIIYINDIYYYCETKFLSNKNNINYMDPESRELMDEKIMEKKKKKNDENPNNSENEENNNNDDDEMKEEEDDESNLIEKYFTKEPINSDINAQFCVHVLYAENRKQKGYFGNFGEDDYIEQGIFKVVKSNYKPLQTYLVTINKKDFTYNIEIY